MLDLMKPMIGMEAWWVIQFLREDQISFALDEKNQKALAAERAVGNQMFLMCR